MTWSSFFPQYLIEKKLLNHVYFIFQFLTKSNRLRQSHLAHKGMYTILGTVKKEGFLKRMQSMQSYLWGRIVHDETFAHFLIKEETFLESSSITWSLPKFPRNIFSFFLSATEISVHNKGNSVLFYQNIASLWRIFSSNKSVPANRKKDSTVYV